MEQKINLDNMIQACRSTIDQLNSNTLIGLLREQSVAFDRALDTLEQVFMVAEKVGSADKEEIGLKAATVFAMALYSKIGKGGSAKDLTEQEWKEIAEFTKDYAVIKDPKEFSLLVFKYYRDAIQFAIEPMRVNAAEETISRLEEIVAAMDDYSEQTRNEEMPETRYIEESLWLSLEAIFLVLSDRIGFGKGKQELVNAAGALVFQQIRYRVYSEELVVVEHCLAEQAVIDAALKEQVDAYVAHLYQELDEFDALIDEAFSADFQTAFHGSVKLAQAMGEENVLKSVGEVDDFFLG